MATLPVFQTFSAGAILTAAQLNNLNSAGQFFLSWPVCETRQTIAQSIPSGGTGATVLFDTNDIDTDGGHSTSVNTDRYTAKTRGRFQVSGKVGYALAGGTLRAAEVWLNGGGTSVGGTIQPPVTGTTSRQATPTFTQFLNGTTDYFQINAFQNSGGAINTATSTLEESAMSVRMVGST